MIRQLLAIGLLLFARQTPNLDRVEVQTIPVQGNVHMLVGAGDNITVQAGPEGIVIVDTSYETLAPKILAAIRKLSDKPIFWIVNTSIDADHIGGNDALPKLANAATRQGVRIVAHENVVNRMTSAAPRSGSRCPGQAVAERRIFSSAKRLLIQR